MSTATLFTGAALLAAKSDGAWFSNPAEPTEKGCYSFGNSSGSRKGNHLYNQL